MSDNTRKAIAERLKALKDSQKPPRKSPKAKESSEPQGQS